MDQQSSGSNQSHAKKHSHSSKRSFGPTRQLFALMGDSSQNIFPYRSKFQLIGSDKSRQSRDSDLLNGLAKSNKKLSSNASSKSLTRSDTKLHTKILHSSNSNSSIQSQSGKHNPIHQPIQTPKIHNCVCFVAGQCLNYNCNCFLSQYPCAPQCCPQCLTLKSDLPLKITNICSCKNTKCLKLYCQCLSKGVYCSIMCRCELCQNHQHSSNRMDKVIFLEYRGCSCQKSQCIKKYCECFAQGLKCTNRCGCIKCCNWMDTSVKDTKDKVKDNWQVQKMQQEIVEEEAQFEQVDFFGGKKK